jgi:TRAP-type C4-dicarboxylate transport system permease large subunit
MLCMVLGIVLLCLFPGLATWLPNLMMGQAV